MDVSKLFQKTPGQEETVPTAQPRPAGIVRQKTPPEVVKEYLDETDSVEDPNENVVSEIETEIGPMPPVYASITQPFYPDRHPLSARFHAILKEVGELHDKKQMDYGTADDPFANVRGATRFGLPAPMGAFIAMSDIMQRIESFCVNKRLENEPLDNALRDMAVYSIIALVLHEEENGQ